MAGKASYTRERPRMKCFLEVIVHWRMIIWLFTYTMWPVNAKKNVSIWEIFLFRFAWKTTSCERKNFFAIYGSFCEIDAFPLGVFSIRNFNLRNLKDNGNAPNDSFSNKPYRVPRSSFRKAIWKTNAWYLLCLELTFVHKAFVLIPKHLGDVFLLALTQNNRCWRDVWGN